MTPVSNHNKRLRVGFAVGYAFHVLLTFVAWLLLTDWVDTGEIWADFRIDWETARLVLSDPSKIYPGEFYYMPAWALAFVPFGLGPMEVAGWWFLIVQVALFGFVLYYFCVVADRVVKSDGVFLLLVVVFAVGVHYNYNYRVANAKMFALFFFTLSVWAEREGKPFWVTALGAVMGTSMVVYAAPLLVYLAASDFHWKRVVTLASTFVACNALFFVPGVAGSYASFLFSTTDPSNPVHLHYQYPDYALFTYLKVVWEVPHVFFMGVGVMLACLALFYLRRLPYDHVATYYFALVFVFYAHMEWQHYSFIVPLLFFHVVDNYALPDRLASLRGWVDGWRGLVPYACLVGLSFPVPSSLLGFLPEPLLPWKRLAFSVTFFAWTFPRLARSPKNPGGASSGRHNAVEGGEAVEGEPASG